MRDLTRGPIFRHILAMAVPIAVGMLLQTMYYVVDLYFVARLGDAALAGVGAAGNLMFVVFALTQMLGVGTTTVVSHAAGRKDHPQALLMFNQSQVLAMVTGVLFLVVGMAVRVRYASALSADAGTAAMAADYLLWFIPAMALQFALVAMGSALRGVGNFKPGMIVSTATIIINMILAPFLIFGWGTGHAFGVAGAAMSSLIAIVVGIVWFTKYFVEPGAYLRFMTADWPPRFDLWRKMLGIGLSEGTAIIVRQDTFEVMGKWKVAVHDNTRVYQPWEKPYYVLSAGDVYNMKTRRIEKLGIGATPPQRGRGGSGQ